MGFELKKQIAKITNLNVRKEAAGDDESSTLAADIKLVCSGMPASDLKPLCPVDSAAQVSIVDALFNDAGSPRFYGMGEVAFTHGIEKTDVVIAGHTFEAAKIKGFTIVKFHDGAKVDLEFTVQVHPSAAGLGPLAEKIKEDVTISVTPQPELPLETPAQDAEATA
jgi:hypothetical protein